MDTLGPAFIGRLSCPLFGGRTFTRKVNVCGVKVCPLLIGCFSIMSLILDIFLSEVVLYLQLLVFGGQDSDSVYNDVWSIEFTLPLNQ